MGYQYFIDVNVKDNITNHTLVIFYKGTQTIYKGKDAITNFELLQANQIELVSLVDDY